MKQERVNPQQEAFWNLNLNCDTMSPIYRLPGAREAKADIVYCALFSNNTGKFPLQGIGGYLILLSVGTTFCACPGLFMNHDS